jgi:hypothetical protein
MLPVKGTDASQRGMRRDEPETKEVNPIKKFIMKVFKIKEIDHEKFREENEWAIKPRSRPRE